MSALVKNLRLLQAWYLPAGPEPEEAMPSKYRAFKEAADTIESLSAQVAAEHARAERAEQQLAEANAAYAAQREVVEMVDDICDLLGVPKDRWHGCYQAVAALKGHADEMANTIDRVAEYQDVNGAIILCALNYRAAYPKE